MNPQSLGKLIAYAVHMQFISLCAVQWSLVGVLRLIRLSHVRPGTFHTSTQVVSNALFYTGLAQPKVRDRRLRDHLLLSV